MRISLLLVIATACGGTVPPVRYYQLAVTDQAEKPSGTQVLVVEPLSSDAAYDDERIVYRSSPYRLDYYHYHRWTATPGALVSGYLQQALGRTGDWKAVVRDQTLDASLVLGGRVVAFEEVDRDKHHWLGRVSLELTLTDPKTGAVVWSQTFDESEPLAVQNPEGLARALSVALGRIAKRTAPQIIATSRAVAASGHAAP